MPREEVLYIAETFPLSGKRETFQSLAKTQSSLPDESRLRRCRNRNQGGKRLCAFVPVVFNLADGQYLRSFS